MQLTRGAGALQEMARSRPIDSAGQRGFKVLVLDEVDRLSKDAQHSLRRTMEKYSAACRLVLCCNNVSKVRNYPLCSNSEGLLSSGWVER